MSSTLDTARRTLFQSLSGRVLTFSGHPVGAASKKESVEAASNADFGNRASLEISNAVVEQILGSRPRGAKLPAQTLGDLFEKSIASYLRTTFLPPGHLRPGKWEIMHVTARSDDVVSAYEQYGHLKDLANFCRQHKELAAALGNDYGTALTLLSCGRQKPTTRSTAWGDSWVRTTQRAALSALRTIRLQSCMPACPASSL